MKGNLSDTGYISSVEQFSRASDFPVSPNMDGKIKLYGMNLNKFSQKKTKQKNV